MNKIGSVVVLAAIGLFFNNALAQGEGIGHLQDSQARYQAKILDESESPVFEYDTEVDSRICEQGSCHVEGKITRDATNKKYKEETVCQFEGDLTIHGTYADKHCGDNILAAYVTTKNTENIYGKYEETILVTKLYALGSSIAFDQEETTLQTKTLWKNPGIKKPGEI